MIGYFKTEKAFRNYCYLLVDDETNVIENISSCIFVFFIFNLYLSVSEYFGNLFKKISES